MNNGKNNNNWVILKFGGTSVATLDCWKTIKSIIEQRVDDNLRPVIVCSAISGASNQIEEILSSAANNNDLKPLQELKEKHKLLANALEVDFSILDEPFETLTRLTKGVSLIKEISNKIKAQALATGEIMSTLLGAAYLKRNGIDIEWTDARNHLMALDPENIDDERNYILAVCSSDEDKELKNNFDSINAKVVITQGFIAKNSHGDTVLLGRGGSDVSAAYFAAKLKAKRCEIWTDVPGMYTANPHKVPSAHVLKSLDYDEAQEIASTGAKVLHPKCISPVRKHKIPLNIYCLKKPDIKGTEILFDSSHNEPQLKAISAKNGITVISMETINMWQEVGFLADIFGCFKKYGLSIDLVSTSESNVTVTLDQSANTLDVNRTNALKRDLEKFCQVKIIEQCALVSMVGKNIRTILHELGPVLEVFEEHKIYLLSQAANDLNLTFIVDEEQSDRLVKKLHNQIFANRKDDKLLGKTWEETFDQKDANDNHIFWWQKRKNELLKIAANKTPLYVYNAKSIDEKIESLKGLKNIDRIFYSIKANPHEEILKRVFDAGLSFECVSPGEIKHIMNILPEIDPNRILFTPNFAPKEEYEYALNENVFVTLDNIFPLEKWPEIFKDKEIFVRIDPGEGRGHHKYVHTAGAKAKFGVWPSELGKLLKITSDLNIKVVGLHAHVGSNIHAPDTWSKTAKFMTDILNRFHHLKYMDLGGGLGVIENFGQKSLDMKKVDEYLEQIKSDYPNIELWIEPGRFISAESGVLLAKVTQTKTKGDYNYVGINAGMNTLIRPALYGSHHEIVNLSKLDKAKTHTANIVGPICETGDILGYSRQIAKAEENDIILISTTGAYGKVMSSRYNLREPAEEMFI